MKFSHDSITPRNALRIAAVGCAVVLGAGCASTQLDAQWSDPQLSGAYLRGARVLVACEVGELVVRQICQDRLAAEVVARGATPVLAPSDVVLLNDRSVDVQLLPAARAAGAKALLVMTAAVAVNEVGSGFSVGFGGFGFGRHSGIGVGASLPVGGARVTSGYTANGRVTDATSGRLLWTAKATSAPSTDLDAQMVQLSQAVLGAADKAGLF